MSEGFRVRTAVGSVSVSGTHFVVRLIDRKERVLAAKDSLMIVP